MMLRTLTFVVPKPKDRAMRAFMRRAALPMVQCIPSCRAAYFVRNQARKNEYMWVTVWPSAAALERARQRKDWKDVTGREEKAGFFLSRPRHVHYDVLLTLARSGR